MRYFAKYNESNELIAIGTGFGGVEINENEYNELSIEIHQKAEFVNRVYNMEITINDVPSEWQEEVSRRVEELIISESITDEQVISPEEFYSMVEEVL